MDKKLLSWFEEKKLNSIFSEKKMPDVVLTDGNSLALSLKYDSKTMAAPVVQIKGKHDYARKIIELANKKNITILDKPELVNSMNENTKVSRYIPEKFYYDIADIYGKELKEKDSEITEKETDKKERNFSELLIQQRSGEYDTFSVIMPERIQIEAGTFLFTAVNDKKFTAETLGMFINNIKVCENKSLDNDEFTIKINGLIVKQEQIKFIYDPYQQLRAHVNTVIAKHSKELIGRDDIVHFITQIKQRNPVLIEETMKYFSVGEIRQIICNLLEESVCIQNITTIFETIADYGENEHYLNLIHEHIRISIGRDICAPLLTDGSTIRGFILSHELEEMISDNIIDLGSGKIIKPSFLDLFLPKIRKAIEKAEETGIKPVFICRSHIRKLLYNALKGIDDNIAVISLFEIPEDIIVEYILELKAPESD